MPEQQASPSSQLQHDDAATRSPESVKRTYLSLLPPPQLIDLILAIDANRQTLIFPHDVDSAIKALQRPQRQTSPLSTKETPPAASVVVKAEPISTPTLPAPQQTQTPLNPVPPVQPPQYKPPPQYRPPQTTHPGVYPYTHTPYYPSPQQQAQQAAHVSAPMAPQRNPLFTSTPLTRDPNKPPVARPTPPPISSRDDPNAMPSYEEMIVEAIMDVGEVDGTAPKVLFAWMASHYPLQQNFRPSASQALHKALKRGRLEKIGGKYRLDPRWGGGPTTSKRATRRPTANQALSPQPPSGAASAPAPAPTSIPPPYTHAHAPYGYTPYGHHPSLPPPHPHPYPYGMGWGAPQTVGQVLNGKADDAEEEDGMESEDVEGQVDTGAGVTETEERKKELVRLSLVRLARILRRVAK